jgi:hypothetical protein
MCIVLMVTTPHKRKKDIKSTDRQILGRPAEIWEAEFGVDKLVVIITK